MSTRSLIAAQLEDGSFVSTYCHFDGYISGVGSTLYHNFNDAESAYEIADMGYLSSLYPDLSENTLADNHANHDDPVYYPSLDDLVSEAKNGIDYVYVWDNDLDAWTVYYTDGHLNMITQVLDSSVCAQPE